MVSSIEEQIKAIEEEIFNTQKNKATEHHIGKLKAKIARLKEEAEKRKSARAKGKGFSIKRSGDATVGIIGFPNVGKSTLLNRLTGASSKTGDYDFTTLEAIPGIMKYKGADIQMLDLPGFIKGASEGKGRGREILSAVRNVDLLLLMIDVQHIEHLEIIERELYGAGLRLNQKSPDVVVTKKAQGGITVHSTNTLTNLNERLIKSIASEFVINADVTIREDITEDQLIDSFSRNRVYVSAMVVINKIDLVTQEILDKNVEELKGRYVVTISAEKGDGLKLLRENIFSHLKLIRVYMKPVGKQTDYDEPLILRKGDRVENACKKLHRDFMRNFRYASVSGPSAKHDVQKVGLKHKLKDEDILTIVIWR
ncbi:MAG: GTP-binding protein [Thermoplasmatales archaeon]|nr:MAG: GTP-binding protein [Thermoplasmatales archaeon]